MNECKEHSLATTCILIESLIRCLDLVTLQSMTHACGLRHSDKNQFLSRVTDDFRLTPHTCIRIRSQQKITKRIKSLPYSWENVSHHVVATWKRGNPWTSEFRKKAVHASEKGTPVREARDCCAVMLRDKSSNTCFIYSEKGRTYITPPRIKLPISRGLPRHKP